MDALVQLKSALTGRYAIDREIGAGGMATVYLARDARHDRNVALKVLNPELGAVLGVERFLSEIKVTANLQHPNLLPLFDSGEAEGLLFYVMPYVEGESLRARLDREKQLPIEEAIRIATAVASALDYAHRHGVIHRDLKPENILMNEGQPLIADFGIALAVSKAGGNRITQTGLSLGTPAYMSPEQATGDRVIDARTDIYSLGAVLYEMLTGDAPHVGSSAQAVIARVLTEKPRSIRASRSAVPEYVERAVDHALEKLPADRFSTAQEFSDALAGKVVVQPRSAASGAGATNWRDALRHPITRVLAAMLVIALVGVAWEWRNAHHEDVRTPIRFTLTFDDSARWSNASLGASAAISPDGELIAFRGYRGRNLPTGAAGYRLYLRSLRDLRSRELPGTEFASQPFFSPDGKWIGFLAAGQIKKILVEGGTPILVANVPMVFGASWGTMDRIVVARLGGLFTVSPNGGPLQPLGAQASGDRSKRWPLALPDGNTVLYSSYSTVQEDSRIAVASIGGASPQILDLAGTQPLAFIDGTLVYATADAAIMAVPFDLRARRPLGAPVPVIDGVGLGPQGALVGAVSQSGTVVYDRGGTAAGSQLMVAAPHSMAKALLPETRLYSFPRYSPDGKHLAFAVTTDRSDVWVFDLPSGPLRRLTTGGTLNDRPEWTPDSRRVLFRSNRGGQKALWVQPADGNQEAELVFKAPQGAVDEGVLSADGTVLILQMDTSSCNCVGASFYRRMSGDTSLRPVAPADKGQNTTPRLSPDGHWIAYRSNELGTVELYVKPFPALNARYQVSLNGGMQPIWSRDSRRLFYLNDNKLLSATLAFAPSFAVSGRDTLLDDVLSNPVPPTSANHANYDLALDGKSFVFVRGGAAAQPQVVVIHDWKYELRERMRAAGKR